MNASGIPASPPPRLREAIASPFTRAHAWDHAFFLLMVACLWVGILMGFVPEILRRAAEHRPPFPWIVHVHAVVFVGFMCLLTAQVLLVSAGKVGLHRKLGIAGACLWAVMIVLGLATAVTVHRAAFGTPQSDPSFIAIQILGMLTFAVVGGAALALRKTPAAHKRLMLLAVIFIADAGFARWWADGLHRLLGTGPFPLADGFWSNWAELYLSNLLLVLALGSYDLLTRRRLHPAFAWGASFGLSMELVAVWLYGSAWWKPVATALIGY
jgi:hypothetical protein